jgi:hypothetical protein
MGEARRRGTRQERRQDAIAAQGFVKGEARVNPHLGPMLVLRHWLACGVRPVSVEAKDG